MKSSATYIQIPNCWSKQNEVVSNYILNSIHRFLYRLFYLCVDGDGKRQGEMIMDKTILKFAESMQRKLDKNKDKECATMNRDGIIDETADIGNFAMMIHDIVSKLS